MSAFNTGTSKRGIEVLHDPRLNKSTGFTEAERQALGLVGQVARAKIKEAVLAVTGG
jgi:malate dehydrogenase (oxaloacetate-decarboxylating)(NADP+)